jgi:signal transduction histidine kinase
VTGVSSASVIDVEVREDHSPLAPLIPTALALVDAGTTPGSLADRLRELGLEPRPDLADELLSELERLGLVRVASMDGREPVRVRTSLGEALHTATAASPDLASRLDELEQLRSNLLATISHELRTPLTAVRTSVGLLLDPSSEPTDEQRRVLLETVGRNADRMQQLIADILDLTRFRQGRIPLQRRTFDAAVLARDAASSIAVLVHNAGQRVRIEAPGRPVPVYGDRPRLERALINLLSNAQKFSPEGAAIDLRVSSDGEIVRWSVIDSGPGIPDADRARLFERFFVGQTDRRNGPRGTGLGLPIALAIAQAHGGDIEVGGAIGEGSAFTLAVPARPTQEDDG